MSEHDEAPRSTSERTSITMPVDLAAFARSRAGGNMSAYLASLVAEDKRRTAAWERLAEFGYRDELAPTAEGRRRARRLLDEHKARRHGGTGQQAA
jgi:hypothetical protein